MDFAIHRIIATRIIDDWYWNTYWQVASIQHIDGIN